MIKSNNERKKLLTPEKAASFIPVFISSGISILLIIFFVIPQYFKSNKVDYELNSLIKKKNELNDLKSQYKIINKKFDKLNREKLKIIELITGRSNLETLLSELGKLGRKNNIKFLSIAPKKIVISDEKNKDDKLNNNVNQSDLENDPLLVEGIKKYLIDFTFKTDFVNLLSFLRDLEFQDNAILLDNIDINISLENEDFYDGEINKPYKMLEVNLSIIFYGKS